MCVCVCAFEDGGMLHIHIHTIHILNTFTCVRCPDTQTTHSHSHADTHKRTLPHSGPYTIVCEPYGYGPDGATKFHFISTRHFLPLVLCIPFLSVCCCNDWPFLFRSSQKKQQQQDGPQPQQK